jgi:hypothetical protein
MPPRYRRSLEDTLRDMAGNTRAITTDALGVPELQELNGEYLAENAVDTYQLAPSAVTADILADNAVGRGSFDQELSATVDDLVTGVGRIDSEILPAIDDAFASPVTDSRLSEGSLTKWPFQQGSIPFGAFAPGAVAGDDLADFSIVVKKLKSDRHHLY